MRIKQIQAFVEVVDQGSFSKAANTIFLSQSTVSMHINALEDELGCKLIVRTPKGVFPSEVGKIFYEYSKQILRLVECAEDSINQYKNNQKGKIIISSSTVPATCILPKVICEFTKRYPDINVTLQNTDSEKVAQAVEKMAVDVGICGYDFSNYNCSFKAFHKDELVIITPNTDEYKKLNGIIPIDILEKSKFIVRENESGTKKQTTLFFENIGLGKNKINSSIQMQDTQSIANAVSYGGGISIISRISVLDKINSGQVLAFEFDNTLLNRHFYIVTHKQVPLSPIAKLFVDFLLEYYPDFK